MKFDPAKSLDNALLKLDYLELSVHDKKIIYILHDPRPNDYVATSVKRIM